MSTLRWLLTVPVAILGWYAGIIVAISIYKSNEWLCPTQHLVSGMCYAPWSSFIEELAIAGGSIISATLVVLLPSLAAPSRKIPTALTAYIFGAFFSIYWLFHGFLAPAAWAITGGSITLWLIFRYNRSFNWNWSNQSTNGKVRV
jgi:hypothetical protein